VGVEKSSEAFSMSVKDIAARGFAGSNVYFLGNIVFFVGGKRVAETKNDGEKKAGMHKSACMRVRFSPHVSNLL
jgi:hypothetical protein